MSNSFLRIKSFIWLFSVICYLNSSAQSIQLTKGDTVLQRVGKKTSVEYNISLCFQLSGRAAVSVPVVLRFKFLRPLPIQFSAGNDTAMARSADGQTIAISFKPSDFPGPDDPLVKKVEKGITIRLLTENLEDSLLNVAIVATNVSSNSSIVVDCSSCNYTLHLNSSGVGSVTQKKPNDNVQIFYLNAYNVDFTNSFTSNYMGEFNVFTKEIENSGFGFNAGFEIINYNVGQSDSSSNTFIQKTLIDPLADSILKSQKYLKQLNKYVTKQQNSSRSLYFQPLFLLKKVSNDNVKIYAHLHVELLINKNILTTTITSLKQDSISPSASIPVDSSFFRYQPGTYVTSTTLLNGYYGVGLTASIKLLDTLHMFFQYTMGYTTNYPSINSVNSQLKYTPAYPPPASITPYPNNSYTIKPNPLTIPKGSSFYYIKGYFDFNLSKSIELLVGSEIRGFFGRFPPYYAVYAGVNLNIQTLIASLTK